MSAWYDRVRILDKSELRHLELERLITDLRRPSIVAPPAVAPALYPKRAGIRASDFLFETYGPYIRAKALFQYQLRALDPGLMVALNNEFAGRGQVLRRILPTKKDQTDQLLSHYGLTEDRPLPRYAVGKALRP